MDKSVENVNKSSEKALQVKLLLTFSYGEIGEKGLGLICIHAGDFAIDGKVVL